MDDLISRQAAIEALIRKQRPVNNGDGTMTVTMLTDAVIKDVLKALPSAQPEERTNERTETHGVCLDTISRQAAIDALWKALYEYEDETEQKFQASDELNTDDWFMHRIFVQNMSDIDRQTILNLPSAQPERKKGKWIEISSISHTYKCSECGRLLVNITDGKNNVARNYPYCHCGAEMDEEGKDD